MLVELIDNLIEDIGAGLNPATIRNRLLSLREQAEAIETRLARVEAQINELETKAQTQHLAPKQDELEEGAVRFLKLLFEGAQLSVQEMAPKLGMTRGMAEYHCGVLSEKEMIHPMSIGVVLDFEEPTPTTWIITSKGRQYLVKNKLV